MRSLLLLLLLTYSTFAAGFSQSLAFKGQSGPSGTSLKNSLLFYWDGSSVNSLINTGTWSIQTDGGCSPSVQVNQAGGILSKTFQTQNCQSCQTVTAALKGDANMASQMGGGPGVSFTLMLWVNFYTGSFNCNTFSYLISKINGNTSTAGDWEIGGTGAIAWTGIQASDNTRQGVPIFGGTGVTIVPGTWYQIIVGYDDSVHQLFSYVNNASQGTTACVGVTASGQQVALFNDPIRLFDQGSAKITEVGFWNRVLTSGERAQLYNSGAALAFSSF